MSGATDSSAQQETPRRTPLIGRSLEHEKLLLLAVLILVSAFLVVTSIPGVFTIDENNYLSTILGLRAGQFTVPGTEELTPSRVLAYFDPMASGRSLVTSPVASTAPPLYAFLVLPFSYLGWRGLIASNVLSFAATAYLVFHLCEKHSRNSVTPWISCLTFLVAGYSIEYAQGVWPHMLSVALCTGAFFLAGSVRDTGALSLAVLAGVLVGLATGVRYQNLVFSAVLGASFLLGVRRRGLAAVFFVLGFSVPLAGSSYINHARLGSWNPVSKGPGWMSLDAGRTLSNPLIECATFLVTKVIDYSLHPVPENLKAVHPWQVPYPEKGTYIYFGGLKKAWVQSSPWLLLSLVLLFSLSAVREPTAMRREIRATLVVAGGVLLFFAASGFSKSDGVCFNQRYFLELVPLLAVVFAWGTEDMPLTRPPFLAGALLGLTLGAVPLLLFEPYSMVRHKLLFRFPLILGCLLVILWALRRKSIGRPFLWPLMLGASLAYAFAVHFGDDIQASRRARMEKWTRRTAVENLLPQEPSALFAHWGNAEPFGPLQLNRDIVILDTHAGPAEESVTLAHELLNKGRRIFVFANGMPVMTVNKLAANLDVRQVHAPTPLLLFEVSRKME